MNIWNENISIKYAIQICSEFVAFLNLFNRRKHWLLLLLDLLFYSKDNWYEMQKTTFYKEECVF